MTEQETIAAGKGTLDPLVVRLSDSVTIIHGDCRDVLPVECDAVVTDPPYGLGKRMSGGTWGKADKYGDMWEWDKEAPHEAVAVVLGLARPTIMWGGNYFAVPPSRCWLSWSKVNVVQTMASMELAWTNFDRPAKEWRGPVGVHDTGHPTQKPVPLMAWCLSFLPEDCAVCDPFMGSGTTGIACIRTGRKFIGIEKDARYFEIARARLEKELRQGRLPLEFDTHNAHPHGTAVAGTVQGDVGNDLEQETHKSQPDDLPLRSGAIGAGEAVEIQRPTAAPLPVSNANLERSERSGDTLRDFVRPAFPGNVMGGRGVCRHCGAAVNNVAYHEANACKRRQNK